MRRGVRGVGGGAGEILVLLHSKRDVLLQDHVGGQAIGRLVDLSIH